MLFISTFVRLMVLLTIVAFTPMYLYEVWGWVRRTHRQVRSWFRNRKAVQMKVQRTWVGW